MNPFRQLRETREKFLCLDYIPIRSVWNQFAYRFSALDATYRSFISEEQQTYSELFRENHQTSRSAVGFSWSGAILRGDFWDWCGQSAFENVEHSQMTI